MRSATWTCCLSCFLISRATGEEEASATSPCESSGFQICSSSSLRPGRSSSCTQVLASPQNQGLFHCWTLREDQTSRTSALAHQAHRSSCQCCSSSGGWCEGLAES